MTGHVYFFIRNCFVGVLSGNLTVFSTRLTPDEFEFFHKNTPLLVNTGTSTYDYGDRRLSERSSSSHNTLSFENKNQDEIWSRFRIARQHKVDYFDLYEFDKGNLSMKGMLTNYDKSYKHIRKVNIKKQFIDIIDEFESSKKDWELHSS